MYIEANRRVQGAGETLRGTLNSTVERHLGSNQQAVEKSQAAIDAGRYEIENKQFYRPDVMHQTVPRKEVGSASSSSRLNSFFQKAAGRPLSTASVEEEVTPPRERMKLRKRSSSRLRVVRE